MNLMTFKALNNLAPVYLSELLEMYQPQRTLRSSSMNLLSEKRSRLKQSGDRAYSVAGPKLWNKLPEVVRASSSLDSFKTELKTFLFRQAFN